MMLINWRQFVINKMINCIRVESVFAIYYACVFGLNEVCNLFRTYEEDVTDKLAYTSQVCAIETVLNIKLMHDVEGGIYTIDSGGNTVLLLQRDTDEEPIMLNNDSTPPPVLIHGDSKYDNSQFDFIVVTPEPLSKEQEYRARALINYYKLAGKRYTFDPKPLTN